VAVEAARRIVRIEVFMAGRRIGVFGLLTSRVDERDAHATDSQFLHETV
jgi:hypothetical protein